MSQTLSPSLARGYGMSRVTRVWKISRASVYRSLKEMPPNTIARRPGPVGACSDAELAEHIRQHIAASRLHGEGYRKLWARLRFAGVRASPRREGGRHLFAGGYDLPVPRPNMRRPDHDDGRSCSAASL